MGQASNVVYLPAVNDFREEGAIPLVIPIDTVERARDALGKLEASASIGLAVLDKAGTYGAEAAIAGVREIFQTLAGIIR